MNPLIPPQAQAMINEYKKRQEEKDNESDNENIPNTPAGQEYSNLIKEKKESKGSQQDELIGKIKFSKDIKTLKDKEELNKLGKDKEADAIKNDYIRKTYSKGNQLANRIKELPENPNIKDQSGVPAEIKHKDTMLRSLPEKSDIKYNNGVPTNLETSKVQSTAESSLNDLLNGFKNILSKNNNKPKSPLTYNKTSNNTLKDYAYNPNDKMNIDIDALNKDIDEFKNMKFKGEDNNVEMAKEKKAAQFNEKTSKTTPGQITGAVLDAIGRALTASVGGQLGKSVVEQIQEQKQREYENKKSNFQLNQDSLNQETRREAIVNQGLRDRDNADMNYKRLALQQIDQQINQYYKALQTKILTTQQERDYNLALANLNIQRNKLAQEIKEANQNYNIASRQLDLREEAQEDQNIANQLNIFDLINQEYNTDKYNELNNKKDN